MGGVGGWTVISLDNPFLSVLKPTQELEIAGVCSRMITESVDCPTTPVRGRFESAHALLGIVVTVQWHRSTSEGLGGVLVQ